MDEQENRTMNGNGNGADKAQKKPNFLVTTAKKVQKALIGVKEKHPILYKAGKVLTGVGAVYGTYKFGFHKGAKSVVPTTVCIQSGVEEDEPEDIQEEETPVEETNEEPVADELSEV